MRYNKRITLKQTRQASLQLASDRGEVYEVTAASKSNQPITDWWEKQNQSDLRGWQKDALFKEFWRLHGELELYMIYKKGQGYSQPHDLALAYSTTKNIWILSTEQHTWLMPNSDIQTVFDIDLAFDSILNHDARLEIYNVISKI